MADILTKVSDNEVRIETQITIIESKTKTIKEIRAEIDNIDIGIANNQAQITLLRAEKQRLQAQIAAIKAIGVNE